MFAWYLESKCSALMMHCKGRSFLPEMWMFNIKKPWNIVLLPSPFTMQFVQMQLLTWNRSRLNTIYVNFIPTFTHWIILYYQDGKFCNLFSTIWRMFLHKYSFLHAYFFIRHYAILKIYSYLIMIYYSNLFCQLWHIFTGICKSNVYWNSLETCISDSNEMYSKIVFRSGQLCEWTVTFSF